MQIKVDVGGLKGKELEALVEADIKRFEAYFVRLQNNPVANDPLDKYEKAILKTYLYWKANVDGAT
jgi:mannitol-1-phosphate/altronate dehydrogenase